MQDILPATQKFAFYSAIPLLAPFEDVAWRPTHFARLFWHSCGK